MNSTFPLMQVRLRSTFSSPVVFAMTFFVFLLNFTPKTLAQTPYCVSKSQAPWQEWIGRVQLNTLDNASDKARADRYVLGYSDWTDKTTTLSKGQSYPLNITPAFSWVGAQPNLFFRVWIDFNGNGTFEDTEKILEQNNGRQAVTSPVTIPTTATIGSKRMRVSMKKDAYSTACETFAAGEVEDYTVQIVDVITPPTTNIVPNGGFEQFTTCPTALSQIHLATGWKALYDDPSANADYNNIGTGCNFTVFSGLGGTVPKTGFGCASFWVASGTGNFGAVEGIQGLLTTPMPQNQIYQLSLNAKRVSTGGTNTRIGRMAVFGIKSGIPIKTNNIGSLLSDPQDIAQYGANAIKLASFDLSDVQGYLLKTAPVISSGFSIGAIIITRDMGGPAGSIYIALDDVSLVPATPSSCLLTPPLKGMATNVTTNSAVIKWQRVSNATNYNYEVRTDRAAGSGAIGLLTSGTAADTFFNLNLGGSGRFQVFVKANCTDGGTSAWSNPISFSTPEFPCNQGALTNLNENFESSVTGSLPPCWRNSIYRSVWNLEANVDIRESSRGTLGNASRRMIMYRTTTVDSTLIMAILPEMSNIGAGTHRLRFKAANTWGNPYAGVGRVQIGTLSNVFDPSTFTPIGAPTIILDNTFREYTVGFANYRGSNRNIAFKYIEGGGDESFQSIEIDDVIWEATGVNPCTTDTQAPVFANCPTNINLTATGTTTIANWTPPTATDNCSTPSVSSTHSSGFAFPVGTTTVVYTAKDALNNTATCSFNVIVATAQLCGQPVNGMVISVTTNTAVVKWQRVPNTTTYSYEVRTGNVAGSGTSGLVTSGIATDTFFNFSGSGRFQIYVRANYNGGGVSQWSSPILFTSLEAVCNQGALTTLSENFEGTTIGFLPTCWRASIFRSKVGLEANVNVSQISHGTLNNTSNRMVMYRSAAFSDSAIIMSILPEMSNVGAGTHRLRFKAANAGTTSIGRVQIGTLSNVFDPSTFTPIGSQTMILDNTFREYTVNFANYRGSDRHIAFKYIGGGFDGNFYSIEIDDVIWEQSTGGTGNDIGLTISSAPTTYRQWTPITVRVSAKNNGTTTMTNVKIDLKRPAKTSSGGTKTPSVGTFRDYCSAGVECSEWTIPSLAAGATATLDAPFFVLDATLPIVVTTNLLASTPVDGTVSNNIATVSIAPTVLAAPTPVLLSYQKPTQLIPIVVQRIAPNPTEGALIVKLESLDAREVTFDFFNVFGQLVKSEKRAVEKGVNRVEFDVYELEQGVHFIMPTTTKGYKVPTKFVKM